MNGLCLPIAKKVIEKFEGQLVYQTALGKGTTFTFTMRLFSTGEMLNLNDQMETIAVQTVLHDNVPVISKQYEINSQELYYNWKPQAQKPAANQQVPNPITVANKTNTISPLIDKSAKNS